MRRMNTENRSQTCDAAVKDAASFEYRTNINCSEECGYDYVIVGAGPAGLQMAYFLHKAQRRYVVYEAAEKAASFFSKLPRHRRLISINKRFNIFTENEFNLRHDWNSLLSADPLMHFTTYSDELYPNADDLVTYLNDFAEHFQLNIKYKTRVTKVSKLQSTFTVVTDGPEGTTNSVFTRCVLLATGAVEENLPTNTTGIELAETYAEHSLNKQIYTNKMVLVIGGGNSAFETANHLADSAGVIHIMFNKQIQFAWNTHYVGDLRAVNNNFIDLFQLKSLNATLASSVVSIEKSASGKFIVTFRDLNTHWETPGWLYFKMEYDHVISCCGWRYTKPDMFNDTITIETTKNGRYPSLNNVWETSTPNLFYIGTATGGMDRTAASGFIHGFRYNIRTLFSLLEERFFSIPFPHSTLPCALHDVAEAILDRFTTGDGIYQMNSLLCDVLLVSKDCVKYYKELPRKYIMEREEFNAADHVFVLYLGYGFDKFPTSAKSVENVHAPEFLTNRCIGFLHPYVEYYHRGLYVDQMELHGNLLVRFDQYACSNFPQWSRETNLNYIKFFINDKLHWTDEIFNLTVLSRDVLEHIFVPLTTEELARIPPEWELSECKPPRDLLSSDLGVKAARVLRPTPEELIRYGSHQNNGITDRLQRLPKNADVNSNLVLSDVSTSTTLG